MADPNAAKLPYENPLAALGGGYYGQLASGRPPDMPMRPPGQEVARMPPGPERNMYVDQIENGHAHLVPDKGDAIDVPATAGMREGRNMDGSLPSNEGYDLRMKLGRGDDGGPISLMSEPPKVPLAPGSPGPPIPPAADSMIGQKKRSGDTKRRRIP